MKTSALLLFAACLLAGCATTVTVNKAPKADLEHLRHIFVEHRLNDNHRLDDLIVQELQRLGYDAAAGPLTMMPPETDAVITYEDVWVFDFTTHMTALDLKVTDNRRHQPMVEGGISRPSVTRMSPEEMVHLTVLKIFRAS
jgi:hypothetical protein